MWAPSGLRPTSQARDKTPDSLHPANPTTVGVPGVVRNEEVVACSPTTHVLNLVRAVVEIDHALLLRFVRAEIHWPPFAQEVSAELHTQCAPASFGDLLWRAQASNALGHRCRGSRNCSWTQGAETVSPCTRSLFFANIQLAELEYRACGIFSLGRHRTGRTSWQP